MISTLSPSSLCGSRHSREFTELNAASGKAAISVWEISYIGLVPSLITGGSDTQSNSTCCTGHLRQNRRARRNRSSYLAPSGGSISNTVSLVTPGRLILNR